MIATAGGVALLIVFLPWYGVDVDAGGFSASESANAWEALGFINILLFLLALVAIGLVAARAAGMLPEDVPWPVLLVAPGRSRCCLCCSGCSTSQRPTYPRRPRIRSASVARSGCSSPWSPPGERLGRLAGELRAHRRLGAGGAAAGAGGVWAGLPDPRSAGE